MMTIALLALGGTMASMGNLPEEIRLRYLYRRVILRGGVRLPLEVAKKLVGPDCAFHLYSTVNDQNGENSSGDPPSHEDSCV
jgi:hypothetical protein